jgi:hypothetical protein
MHRFREVRGKFDFNKRLQLFSDHLGFTDLLVRKYMVVKT